MFDHLCHIAHTITIDSAADELASAADMHATDSWAAEKHGRAFMPGLRFVLRDKAHAVRRFLERPWKASTYLSQLLHVVCVDSTSLAQMVQHSHEFQMWYKQRSEANLATESGAFSTFRAARHRFETNVTPLS